MRVKCDGKDGCGKEFQLNPDDFKAERVRDDIERTFFCCPHCGKEYTGFYSNTRIRNKQQKMRDLQGKYNRTRINRDWSQAEKLADKMKKLKEDLNGELKNLRERVEGDLNS